MEPLTTPLFHHRRKPSTLSSINGVSFSGKDDYGDLLSGGNKKTKFRRGVAVEDYSEIFGGGLAGGGRGSSIPVLDLSDFSRENGSGEYRSSNESKLDYSMIFGGLGSDGGGGYFTAAGGVPPYEELFGKSHKSKSDKAKPRITSDLGSPMKNLVNVKDSVHGSGCLSEAPSEAKQVNVSYHKTSQPSKDGSNGTTHIAQLNAVPGFTHFVNRDTHQDHDNCIKAKETEINDKGSGATDEHSDGKSGRRAKWKAQNEQKAQQGSKNGESNINLSGVVNRRLFHSGEVIVPPPSSSPIDRAHTNGKMFYSGELDLKSRQSKVLNDNKLHINQSKSFTYGSKVDSPEKDSDEELDVNSAAAISAAALKKAVEQAQESIKLAKEIMERKRERMKTRSRSTVKVKDVIKETKHDQHVISVSQKNMNDALEVHNKFDQKNTRGKVQVFSTPKDREGVLVNKNNVEVQKPVEKTEAVEGGGMSVWITQVLNNGKNKLAAFASQLADKSEKVDEEDVEITKAPVTNLESCNCEKTGSVASVLSPKASEKEPSTFHRATDSDTDISDSETNLNARVLEKIRVVMSEKKDCQEIKDDMKIESKIQDLEESIDEAKMVFKLQKDEINGSIIDVVDIGLNSGEFCEGVGDDGQPNVVNGKESDEKNLEDVAEIWSECYSHQETDEQIQIESPNEVGNQILLNEDSSWEELDQYEAKDHGHIDAIDSIENREIDVNDEAKENVFAEGETDEGRESSKYVNENHLNRSFDLRDNDNIVTVIEKIENYVHLRDFCTEQVSQPEDKTSVEGQACELDSRNSESNNDLEFNAEENEVKREIEEEFGSKESKSCETSHLRNNGADDLVREVDEKEVEQAVEDTITVNKSEFYEESVNIEEGDVLQSLERENDAVDDIECELDEKEVAQSVEGAFRSKQMEIHETRCVGQSNVQENVLEATIEHESEVLASDEKTDNVGAATTTHEEEIIREEIPTNVNLLRLNAFIEEHVTDNDRDKDNSNPENSMPNIEIDDVDMKIKEDHDRVNPKNTTTVHDVNDAIRKDSEKDSNLDDDHQESVLIKKPEDTKSAMETFKRTECSEDNSNRTKKESSENKETVQRETERTNFKNDYLKKIELAMRERERQDRIAVERAIREARERAFVEARERAERASVEKANAEARQRSIAAAREKLGKVGSGSNNNKAFSESKLKAERSAVERATAEARERALEKAMSQKTNTDARKSGTGKSPSVSPDSESSGESNNESAQRRKARLERHQRIMERAANALAEKNMRDILAQREQTERNRLAETLDAEIKRWASGKEGNLRALLSTLQYILGASSGWQPITLTEMITTSAVKKAYRKATLYVHPDKLQQKGASIQQKYICEKVFDLLQAAWNKFNSEER